MTTEVVAVPQSQSFELEINPKRFEMVARNRQQILEFIAKQLAENTDFGKIPGCGDKPTLLQPGAQKICSLVNAYPDTQITVTELGNGHREYQARTVLRLIGADIVLATGNGSCSTLESKYKYRGTGAEDTGAPVPPAYWTAKRANNTAKMHELLGGKGFSAKKNEAGEWTIHKSTGEKLENPDIADVYNTCLKIASKRSLVAATLNLSGGWSEHFTQDLEDMKGLVFEADQDKAKNRTATLQAAINGAQNKGLPGPKVKEILDGAMESNGVKSITTCTEDEFQKVFKEFTEDVATALDELKGEKKPSGHPENENWQGTQGA